MNITVVDLSELPHDILEQLTPLIEQNEISTLTLTKRFCLDCGIRWRSERIRRELDLEAMT